MFNIRGTIFKIGNFRVGFHKNLGGKSGCFTLLFKPIEWTVQLFVWMFAAFLLIIYWFFRLIFLIPYKIVTTLNKCRNDAVLDANNVPKFFRSDTVFWVSVIAFPPLALFILFLREDKTILNRILCGLCTAPFLLAWISIIV